MEGITDALAPIGTFIEHFGFPVLVALYFMYKDAARDKLDKARDKREEKVLELMHKMVHALPDEQEDSVHKKLEAMKEERP